MRVIISSFLGSSLLHLLFLFLASMQYREQVQHLFSVDAPKEIEQRVCFAAVVPPPVKKKKESKVDQSVLKKIVSIVQKTDQQEKEKINTAVDEASIEKSVEKKKESIVEKTTEPVVRNVAEEKKTVKKKEIESKKITENDLMSAKERNELRRMQKKLREKFLLVSSALKKEIGRQWHPPVCDQEDLEAKVCCTLSPRGHLEQAFIEKSSLVMAYDLSILRALKKMSFVRELWGKRFLILFKK